MINNIELIKATEMLRNAFFLMEMLKIWRYL